MALQRLDTKLVIDRSVAEAPNLTDRFKPEDLAKLGGWIWDGYQRDEASRQKWKNRMNAAMDMAMQIQKDKNFPWPGCANVTFPLISIASLQFSSRAYSGLFQGNDLVRYRVLGKDPQEQLRKQADRIGRHMSWQVTEEDVDWEEQHDRLLINAAIVGCNFIKTRYDPGLRYVVSELVMARDFVINYWAKSVEGCGRKTQIIPLHRNQIHERVLDKTFRNVLTEDWFNSVPSAEADDSTTQSQSDNRRGQIPPSPSDSDTPYRSLEQHCLLDLDHDGYYEPYVATIEASSKKVLQLAARWEREEDVDRTDFPGSKSKIRRIKSTEYFTKFGFIPAPDGGIYDMGFGTLLGPVNESVNSAINQLLDNGTLLNSNGGFLGRGVKIRGGAYTVAPWTWKRVDSTGDDLRKGIVQFPAREPPEVLFKLLGLMIEYADRLAGTTEMMVGENPGQNTPAETSRNMIEQGTKVYAGIYKRFWRSEKEEFKKRHHLNSLFLESKKFFGSGEDYVTQEDYRSNPDLVVPSADPNLVSDAMRVSQAMLMRDGAHSVPGYDVAWVEKNWLKALKVESIDLAYPGADKVPPLPNPKAALEQIKLQGVQMKLAFEKQKFLAELMSSRNKTQAEVVKLYAEVGKLLAETQTEKVKAKIEAFEAIVSALETHQNMLNSQIEAMSGGSDGESGKGKRGGMDGVEGASGDSAAVPSIPAAGAAGANGAMGGGAVSG